ncbi:TolC family protein [Tatumella ptyseos]|uniref:TolC family protein n=1 Tax=Tatumella ptyseos TaxID=82987 RepID=UPI0026F23F41|nr:TolC family protein [Tatumella ptyseos]WKX27352.1 TolC family protein [Tatumella ptyseos]
MNKNILLCLVLTTQGCTLSPQYIQPRTVIDDQHILMSGKSYQAYHFKDLFQDDQALQALLIEALKNNYDLQQALMNIRAANILKLSALFDLIPQVRASVNHSTLVNTQTSPFTGVKAKTKNKLYQSSLGVDSYEIDIWGRKQALIESKGFQEQASLISFNAAKLTLLNELASSWYETLSYIKIWHFLNDKLERMNDIHRKMLVIEISGRLDPVIQAKFLRGKATDENSKRKIEKEIITRLHKLHYLAGAESDWLNLSTWRTIDPDYSIKDIPQQISSQVIFQRPDIVVAEMNIRAENGNIGAARSAFLPIFNLFAMANQTSEDFGHTLANLSNNWTLTPSVFFPIFNIPSNYATLRYAKIKKESTVIEYQRRVSEALLDIKNSVASLHSATESRLGLEHEAKLQADVFTKVQARLDAGYLDLYSYYEAMDMKSLVDIELEYSRQQCMLATIVLLKAIGG